MNHTERKQDAAGKYRCVRCGEILRPCGDDECGCLGTCACFSAPTWDTPTCPVCDGEVGRDLHSETDHERRTTPFRCSDCGREYRLQRMN